MNRPTTNATIALYPNRDARLRLFALWYFGILMIAWNIAGHTFLGFEQAWITPVLAVLSAVFTQLALEWLDARSTGRLPRYTGSWGNFLNFLPPAMITGFACAMLLYPNDRVAPIVFASVLSIASKVLFRIRLSNGKLTHFLNPSNFGIAATLLLLPDIGQAPPYQFTENITGWGHWILPSTVLVSGIIVHRYATGRLPLILAWLVAFVAQGVFRAWLADVDWYVPLMPMSSTGFILFTLYMIPDPATTPLVMWRQVTFGASVAILYAILQLLHIVYGLFLALVLVCVVRGAFTAIMNMSRVRRRTQRTNLHIAPSPAGMEQIIYRPTVTLQDTNAVGNVYFLTYLRWQLEAWLQGNGARLSASQLEDRHRRFASDITKWTTEFLDPVGATVGDHVEVRMQPADPSNAGQVEYEIVRMVNDQSQYLANGKIELGGPHIVATRSPRKIETQACYTYRPSLQFEPISPLQLLAWQGKCREMFLIDHAPETLKRVVQRKLALQTTSVALEVIKPMGCESADIEIQLRLMLIKCGQLSVGFDYVRITRDGHEVFATGSQTMSSKAMVEDRLVPCPLPVDLLMALSNFASTPAQQRKIDEIIDFALQTHQAPSVADGCLSAKSLK